jgi:hypothetical protein
MAGLTDIASAAGRAVDPMVARQMAGIDAVCGDERIGTLAIAETGHDSLDGLHLRLRQA